MNEMEPPLPAWLETLTRYSMFFHRPDPDGDVVKWADLVQACPPPSEGEQKVRQSLWLNHGCSVVTLYGDDGEMQCNASSCRLDFKREPLPALLLRLWEAGRLHTGLLPSPPPSEAPDRMTRDTERLDAMVTAFETLQARGFYLHDATGQRLDAQGFQNVMVMAGNAVLSKMFAAKPEAAPPSARS